jgi:hypothetical protein
VKIACVRRKIVIQFAVLTGTCYIGGSSLRRSATIGAVDLCVKTNREGAIWSTQCNRSSNNIINIEERGSFEAALMLAHVNGSISFAFPSNTLAVECIAAR